MSAKKKTVLPKPQKKTGLHRPAENYVVREMDSYTVALSSKDSISGILIFDHSNFKFRAICPLAKIHLARLARGNYKDLDDYPVDQNHKAKSDFAMLVALRKSRIKGRSLHEAESWRFAHFIRKKDELERFGKRIKDADWEEAIRIASSEVEFEKYASAIILAKISSDAGADCLTRWGNWIKSAKDLESGYLDPTYENYLHAVELAADKVAGIPTKKEVREEYENIVSRKSGTSVKRPGRHISASSLMKQLHFDWLPAAGRGPNNIQNRCGFKTRPKSDL